MAYFDLDKLEDQIKTDEGFKAKPYHDSVGVLTIGYGTNLDQGITEDQASSLLMLELDSVITELQKALPWVTDLSDVRQRVLYNMAYNLGVPSLLKFTDTLAMIKQGDYTGASIYMLRSKWAGQVGDRAKRLSVAMKDG